MENNWLHNPHAGEILKHEFLKELGMTEKDLAEAIGIPHLAIEKIVQAKAPMTAAIDLRLCRYFKLSEGYFLRLQNSYDLMEAKRKLGKTLEQINCHPSVANS